ncbi:CO/xanthine dehydrogenase Mo-binding subunit [Streptomyces ambofaciens]
MTTATTGRTALKGVVGTPHTRVEGRDKVTGAARYAGEIPFADLAHGWLVLSTVARGRIRAIDTEPVLAMPGVLAVLHHGNAPRVDTDYIGLLGMSPDPTAAVFQQDRVHHVGWPVALVVAETPEQAREAAEALVVAYDEEPHDTTLTTGHPGAHPAGAGSCPARPPRATWRPVSPPPRSWWTRSTPLRKSTTA